ncbi:MAG: hypothetical protein M1488_05750 [Gammaproteobacteria bacterium]|nr:hypothetical protein [Gammaproteobacteria bacterium]
MSGLIACPLSFEESRRWNQPEGLGSHSMSVGKEAGVLLLVAAILAILRSCTLGAAWILP